MVVSILVLILSPFQTKMSEHHRSILLSNICRDDVQQKYNIYKNCLKGGDNHQISSYFEIQESSTASSSVDELHMYIEELKLKAIKIYESVELT